MACFLVFTFLSGCGEPRTYPVSGRATFNGKPIPVGNVTLAPDTAAGNQGPTAMAEIKDGQFSTAGGKGVVGGPYVVWVSGFDGVPTMAGEGPAPGGKELFPRFEQKMELAAGEAVLELKVPASQRFAKPSGQVREQ